jgi:hypothetical protein
MRASPGFTAVAVLSLALAIGANTAIFSLINPLLLRSLPVRNPQELVEFLWLSPRDPRMNYFRSKDYARFREQNTVLSELIAVRAFRVDGGADNAALNAESVVGHFFEALGIEPAIGRLIRPQDKGHQGHGGKMCLKNAHFRAASALSCARAAERIPVRMW